MAESTQSKKSKRGISEVCEGGSSGSSSATLCESSKMAKPVNSIFFKTANGRPVEPSARKVFDMDSWLTNSWKKASDEEVSLFLQMSQVLLID
mmetsp:Transcript_21279/g.30863  ORF Transcript_21279/g.30863 Transcript_21279/m.30863 type:complete len:93 (-) Transcript_21279:308-586(-)|eukprot:CAMPEP_0113939416 /NCGR_PEP_ID=MMETSP1339-20121228/5735_1 /TAXON_ID=94617 /ORGANISM="Fibrocapsa japonica" /LENGTH=92 /DNA_ID=CAMNT_0000942915 /DNA_START=93 /DNA_END=371 /DNA_ORIENTATION=- /assembly_acc=CAM_ASM_000762